tara:strand:- start:6368 stop:6553 length:186 start_codon:yes stop_codon:yes gene_type:complete
MTDEKEVREWRIPIGTAGATSIGERILNLTMWNPEQVFRVFRAGDQIYIVAVEGEKWLTSN